MRTGKEGIVMTNEQLVTRIKAGVDVADNMLRLWTQCRRFIFKMSNRYRGCAEEDDLTQEGYLGLCRAVDGYDPGLGVDFLPYAAHWIRQAMARFIHNNGTVRIPVHEQGSLHQYRRLCNAFLLEEGREPTEREIGHYLGMGPKAVGRLKEAARMASIGSLDAPLDESEDISLSDAIAAPYDLEADALDKVQAQQLKAAIWPLVDALPGRQPEALRARYRDGKTLKEAAAQMGCSFQNAERLCREGLRELRKPGKAKRLRPFLEDYIDTHAYAGNGAATFNRTWSSSTERTALGLLEKGLQNGTGLELKNRTLEKNRGQNTQKSPCNQLKTVDKQGQKALYILTELENIYKIVRGERQRRC